MYRNNKLLLLLLAFVLVRSALTAPTKETSADLAHQEKDEEDRLGRQLLTSIFGGAAAAGASGLALPALASFAWRPMLVRGLFMIFQWLMNNHDHE